jgi:predicted nucleotidyltransferase
MARPPLPPAVNGALHSLAARVRERFGDRVFRLVLFGSFARGDGRLPDSDVDVLVAIEAMTAEEMREIAQLAAEIGTDHTLALVPLPMDADEYRKYERQQRLLAREIASEGVPL